VKNKRSVNGSTFKAAVLPVNGSTFKAAVLPATK
jgi:hypothetical protein